MKGSYLTKGNIGKIKKIMLEALLMNIPNRKN